MHHYLASNSVQKKAKSSQLRRFLPHFIINFFFCCWGSQDSQCLIYYNGRKCCQVLFFVAFFFSFCCYYKKVKPPVGSDIWRKTIGRRHFGPRRWGISLNLTRVATFLVKYVFLNIILKLSYFYELGRVESIEHSRKMAIFSNFFIQFLVQYLEKTVSQRIAALFELN